MLASAACWHDVQTFAANRSSLHWKQCLTLFFSAILMLVAFVHSQVMLKLFPIDWLLCSWSCKEMVCVCEFLFNVWMVTWFTVLLRASSLIGKCWRTTGRPALAPDGAVVGLPAWKRPSSHSSTCLYTSISQEVLILILPTHKIICCSLFTCLDWIWLKGFY